MSKQKVFALKLLLSALIVSSLPVHAEAKSKVKTTAPHTNVEELDKELVDSELGAPEEKAPAPEYPYPGAKEEGIVDTSEADAVQTSQPSERPAHIDPETGDYYYDTTLKAPVPKPRPGDRNPEKVRENGEYIYNPDTKPPKFSGRKGVEAPTEISETGEFKYKTEHSPMTGTASFRLGFFASPVLVNPKTKTTFQDVYTKDQLPVLFGDYEWPLLKSLGHIGIKFGSGLFIAQGKGIFVNQQVGQRRPDDKPTEQYTFFMFPNTLTAQYRFQYAEKQIIVPYVEGGFGYFTFIESRDDSAQPKIGGAATSVLAGGANLLLDWLDPEAIGRLDDDYGINHIYLTVEFRQIIGLNKSYDFTSSVINAGFLLQF